MTRSGVMTLFPACCLMFLAGALLDAEAQSGGTAVYGRVLDATGRGVDSAIVTLQCATRLEADLHTTTAKDGSYRIEGLTACNYAVNVTAPGKQQAAARLAVAGEASVDAADIQLIDAQSPARAAATQEKPKAPQFEAAGIRGLIDPGGYSASISANEAKNVLTDMTGVQREQSNQPKMAAADCPALQSLLQAVRLEPKSSERNRSAGLFLLEHGIPREASAYLRTASLANPHSLEVRLDWAEALIESGQYLEAETNALPGAEAAESWRVHELRGRAAHGLGRFTEAAREFALVDRLAPSSAHTFAVAYEQLIAGQTAAAAKTLQNGLLLYPHSVNLWSGKGAISFFEHKNDEAIDELLHAAALDPNDPTPYPLLSHVGIAKAAFDPSIATAFERHLAVSSQDARSLTSAGAYLLQFATWTPEEDQMSPEFASWARAKRAEEVLKRAVAIDPAMLEAHIDLATIYDRTGRYRDEITQLTAANAETSADRTLRYRLGMAYRHDGQPARASEYIRASEKEGERQSESQEELVHLLSSEPAPRRTSPSEPCAGGVSQSGR